VIDLSILIPSLHSRAPLLAKVIHAFDDQRVAGGFLDRVEVLTDVDEGVVTIGSKRNSMIAQARGRYVCFFDDDDHPSDDYVSSILGTLDRYRAAHGQDPDCITFEMRYTVDGQEKDVIRFGIHDQDEKRWPNHLTPVKAELARGIRYTLIRFGEDRVFWRALHPHLKTEAHVPKVLYHYDFSTTQSTSTKLRREPDEPVVVCLTTIPGRQELLSRAVLSIGMNTRRPDEIRIYREPGKTPVPIAGPNIRVLDAKDIGPLTKLSAAADPTLPPDAIIVTADDDVIYGPTWLATLVKAAKDVGATPAAVGFCGWSARTLVTLGRFAWDRGYGDTEVLEGWAGAAYRRKWFDQPTLRDPEVDGSILRPPSEFRNVDDVWISAYLESRKIRRKVIAPGPIPATPTPEGNASGLHTRPNWLEENRTACRIGFGL